MKRNPLRTLCVLCLLSASASCNDKSGDPNSANPPPPQLPQGQMWTLIESQMAGRNETQARVRESLLDQEMMTVMICGSNSPIPSTPGAQACTAVFVNGQFLVFDAGAGAARSMEDLGLPVADISALFVTHFHNDHFADVGEVIQRSWVLGRRRKLPIYGGKGVDQLIAGFTGAYAYDYRYRTAHHGEAFMPSKAVDVAPNPIELAKGKSRVVYEKDGVVVTAFTVNHPPVEPALGYAVTFEGKKVVISGDTTDTETLRQQSIGADVLVSEVMNKEVVAGMEAISAKNGWDYNATVYHDIRSYHIDVHEVGELAKAGGVKTLVLTHAIPAVPQESAMQLWYALPIKQHYDGNLLIAHDGTMVKTRTAAPAGGREIVTERYPSGAVRSEVSYLDKIKDGIALTWYESGALRSEVKWTMGTGRAVEYAPNGALVQPSVHPDYSGKLFNLSSAKALIVTTSVETMGGSGAKTGVFASEMTAPYYEFLGAGMEVDIASIKGGKIPIDPLSFLPQIISKYDTRYQRDNVLLAKTNASLKIDDLDFTEYDVIFIAGGWGAAYDLGFSDALGEKLSVAHKAGIPLGAVCHGSLGFLRAIDASGNPLVKGRRMTGVTDKQVKELGIEITPQHPETELRKAGAIFESITTTQDFLANYVVSDGSIVTGQNQNAGAEVAHRLMELVEKNQSSK
ncbi:MAG: MBL fold metallo-hydrolase [Deltaproteobacteria bacterium]|nr:MBL fold metallo-hydrolase [Deltaproteobacteria bacterium]